MMNPILWMCGVIRQVFKIPRGLSEPAGLLIKNNVFYNNSEEEIQIGSYPTIYSNVLMTGNSWGVFTPDAGYFYQSPSAIDRREMGSYDKGSYEMKFEDKKHG